jgi:uncharacterized protein (TIRG00374 family)
VCLWELDRIALGTGAWFPIVTAQLSGNAVGRFVPGAPTPFTVELLHKAGVDTGQAAAAFTASTGLQLATTAALPLLALPAIIGGAPVDHGLADAAYLGVGVLVLLLAVGAVVFTTDRPLELAGRAIQWLLNATVRRHRPVVDLPHELLADRDFIRATLGGRWKPALVAAVANTGFDYLALLCALRAVGAAPRPSLVVLAYTAAELLALLPFTPGGLGFVEAGLVGTLSLAGVGGPQALTATLLYRLAADSRRRRRLPPVPPPLPLTRSRWRCSPKALLWDHALTLEACAPVRPSSSNTGSSSSGRPARPRQRRVFERRPARQRLAVAHLGEKRVRLAGPMRPS